MPSTFDNAFALWSWPLQFARLAGDLAETTLGAQRVIAARMPTIGAAMANPFTADRAELGRMVSEKVAAFGDSGRTVAAAGDVMRRSGAANARMAARMAAGKPTWPADWFGLFEANLAAAAAVAALPAAAFAPIHDGVKRNDKRLGR